MGFLDFFPTSTDLDEQALIAAVYKSIVLPETLGTDDVKSLCSYMKVKEIQIWIYEYGSLPHVSEIEEINACLKILKDEFMSNVLLKMGGVDVFIWLPEEHEYFVVFGALDFIEKLKEADVLNYDFNEYLSENYILPESKGFLSAVYRRYSIK